MHREKVLNVKVIEAHISRITEATQDPFVLLKYGNQLERTDIKENTPSNPKWNQTFFFKFKPRITNIEVECYDFDSKSKSDLIGGGIIDLTRLKPLQVNKLSVEIFYKEKSAGKISIEVIVEGDIVEPEETNFQNEFADNLDQPTMAESKFTEENDEFNASFQDSHLVSYSHRNPSKDELDRENERLRQLRLKEKRANLRLKKANDFKEFLEKSGVSVVFQSIFNEILGKNIPEEEIYKYTAGRLKEIGKTIQEIDEK